MQQNELCLRIKIKKFPLSVFIPDVKPATHSHTKNYKNVDTHKQLRERTNSAMGAGGRVGSMGAGAGYGSYFSGTYITFLIDNYSHTHACIISANKVSPHMSFI